MENNNKEAIGNIGMSRRLMLKTTSVAATALVLGAPAGATCSQPAAVDYGATPLAATNVNHLLAAWLFLTTSSGLVYPTIPSDAQLETHLMRVAGLNQPSARAVIQNYSMKRSSFGDVRGQFHQMAQTFAAGKAPYNNGNCPDVEAIFYCIANLTGS
jgi:hypothetical protein